MFADFKRIRHSRTHPKVFAHGDPGKNRQPKTALQSMELQF
jgi:hypothetical protein